MIFLRALIWKIWWRYHTLREHSELNSQMLFMTLYINHKILWTFEFRTCKIRTLNVGQKNRYIGWSRTKYLPNFVCLSLILVLFSRFGSSYRKKWSFTVLPYNELLPRSPAIEHSNFWEVTLNFNCDQYHFGQTQLSASQNSD